MHGLGHESWYQCIEYVALTHSWFRVWIHESMGIRTLLFPWWQAFYMGIRKCFRGAGGPFSWVKRTRTRIRSYSTASASISPWPPSLSAWHRHRTWVESTYLPRRSLYLAMVLGMHGWGSIPLSEHVSESCKRKQSSAINPSSLELDSKTPPSASKEIRSFE